MRIPHATSVAATRRCCTELHRRSTAGLGDLGGVDGHKRGGNKVSLVAAVFGPRYLGPLFLTLADFRVGRMGDRPVFYLGPETGGRGLPIRLSSTKPSAFTTSSATGHPSSSPPCIWLRALLNASFAADGFGWLTGAPFSTENEAENVSPEDFSITYHQGLSLRRQRSPSCSLSNS